jgi:hypothetical protein
MMKRDRRGIPVALAEKFFWEVFLTEQWNHIFQKQPLLPHQMKGVCPTERQSWAGKQCEGDLVVVRFLEECGDTNSVVTIGMRGECMEERHPEIYLWYPNSLTIDILIHEKRLWDIAGSRLQIPTTLVWFKGSKD